MSYQILLLYFYYFYQSFGKIDAPTNSSISLKKLSIFYLSAVLISARKFLILSDFWYFVNQRKEISRFLNNILTHFLGGLTEMHLLIYKISSVMSSWVTVDFSLYNFYWKISNFVNVLFWLNIFSVIFGPKLL